MPELPLQVRLEVTNHHPAHFTLTFNSSQYSVTLNPETNVTFSDWLRRLHPVLIGQNDPAGQLAPQELLHNVGTWLWQALLPDNAPVLEREALTIALRTGRTPLLLTLPEMLAGLPWELLCDPEQPAESGFLARRRPLVRFNPFDVPATSIAPPLRVLMLSSPPPGLGEDSRVDVESERAAVEQATREVREAGLLHLLTEDIVTPKRVHQALVRFKPHIVHYIGHGEYNKEAGSLLLWEDEQGNALPFYAANLADLLRPRDLSAVVLHACETGRRDARTDVLGMAGTLVKEGIPAVLAQQANLTYESSQLASEAWYTALTAGQGFAGALFEIRQALAQADRPDWAVPILQGSAASLMPSLDVVAPPGPPDPLLTEQGATLDLPAPTGAFVGRHPELRALRLMLESAPGSGSILALITGPGGIGKSTLAAQAVTYYGRRYKAAITLSCLGYQSVEIFLRRIGEFLKRQGAPGFLEQTLLDPKLSTQAKIEEAIVVLNQTGPFLLLIDNLESAQNDDHTLHDKPLLHLLQKLLTNLRGGRVLITGRYEVKELHPYGKFAAHLLQLDLGDLSPYETNQLLIRHPTLAALGEVVRKTLIREFGGLPYIYDLLSSKAASQNLDLLIHDVQGRITQERKRRTAEEWREVRRQVLEFTALEEIIKHLSEQSRLLLAHLGVLRLPFPLLAIEQELGATRTVWQPLLDWSLLRYNPLDQTYDLHSLTRHYAEHLLDEQDRTETQAQLANWYERYARQGSYNTADIIEAHRLWRAAGNVRKAGEIVIQDFAEPLRRFGFYAILRELCMITLYDLRGSNEALVASTQYELGNICLLQGDYKEAQEYYEQCLAIEELQDNQNGQAATLHQLGMIAELQGNYEKARRLYKRSLDIANRLEDQSGRASSLHQLGTIALDQGDYEEARGFYEQSLTIMKLIDKKSGQANTLGQLGTLAQMQGNYEEARGFYEQSLTIAEQMGDKSGQAGSLHQLGMIAQDQGDYKEAQGFYERGLAITQLIGDLSGQAGSLHQLGTLAYQQGNFEKALAYTVQAFILLDSLHSPSRDIALRTIASIHNHIDEATFRTHWQAYAGDRPLPTLSVAIPISETDAGQQQAQAFITELNRLSSEVVTTLRGGSAEKQEALATRLEQMLKDDFPLRGTHDFLKVLIAWLRGQDTQALFKSLQPQHRDVYTRMVAVVEQGKTSSTGEGNASSLTVADLPRAVSSLILQGSTEQRKQVAAWLIENQQQLSPEEAALGRFFGCLAAALREETPEATLLETPYTELWRAFQDALSAP